MPQKDKSLLFKDLCARLPYGVKVQGNFKWGFDGQIMDDIRESVLDIETLEWLMNGIEVRPYLRPMSSMTEEEKQVLELCNAFVEPRSIELKVDFYNQCHLDYRGLIDKGLAIEVTEENNPYKD